MSTFKSLYEGKTDVDRYHALMKQTDGDWNVWDSKQKKEYIKKWSWDSTKMKLVKRKDGDKEMTIPNTPEEKKADTKQPEVDASGSEVDAAKEQAEAEKKAAEEEAKRAEEQRKNEIKARKNKIKQTRNVSKELEGIANKLNKTSDGPGKNVDLDIKVLAAIRSVSNTQDE
jgi:hypothetical protein